MIRAEAFTIDASLPLLKVRKSSCESGGNQGEDQSELHLDVVGEWSFLLCFVERVLCLLCCVVERLLGVLVVFCGEIVLVVLWGERLLFLLCFVERGGCIVLVMFV